LFAGSLAFVLSACTTNDPGMQFAMTGNAASSVPTVPGMMAEVANSHAAANPPAVNPAAANPASASTPPDAAGAAVQAQASNDAPQAAGETAQPAMASTGTESSEDIPLPDVVAYVPAPNPADPFAAAMPALESPAAAGEALPEIALVPQPNPVASGQIPVPADIPAAASNAAPQAAAAYAEAPPQTPPHKPRGFFATLFASSSDNGIVTRASAHEQPQVVASHAGNDSRPLIDAHAAAKPILDLDADTEAPAARHGSTGVPLPGVRSGNDLFEITRKSGTGDNSDVDIEEEGAESVEVASAAGMARLDPNGLLLQRDTVDTACLRPALLAVLKKIEQHYGRKLVVTSGFRSRIHNAAARGARNSLHMYCAAADVQMPGVSKWELAAYARSMPGRGGVGTYCYTKSVHIDIGPERDWNWRCRRKRHHRR